MAREAEDVTNKREKNNLNMDTVIEGLANKDEKVITM